MNTTDPATWTLPTWRLAFVGAQCELEMLREFSTAILQQWPGVTVKLNIIEEGYICVEIFKGTHEVAELYVVDRARGQDPEDLWYGLFFEPGIDDDEHYFQSTDEGIRLLADRCN